MRRKTKIIQISGIRGLCFALFTFSCLAAGFVAFPAIVAMHIWNFAAEFIAMPIINFWQGLMLWTIVAITGFIINDRKKFLVAFKTPDKLTDQEVKSILEHAKMHSQGRFLNSMILKSGDMKPVEKVDKSEEKSEKEKENV